MIQDQLVFVIAKFGTKLLHQAQAIIMGITIGEMTTLPVIGITLYSTTITMHSHSVLMDIVQVLLLSIHHQVPISYH